MPDGSALIPQLGSRKRVSVSEFKGKLLVDIREYYEDKADGSMKPGKKGEDEEMRVAVP